MRQILWRMFFLITIATITIVGFSPPVHAGKWYAAEVLDDRCSGDVVIKVPYTGSNAPSLDDKDVILARSQSLCNLIEGQGQSPGGYKGVCGINKWTEPIAYSSISSSDGRFRWFCGTTPERSRCTSGTGRIRSRLGTNRLLRTECQKFDPT